MAYYNRLSQWKLTMRTIAMTAYRDVEVIIVDDASLPEHRLEPHIDNFRFPIKLIRVEPDQKTWINPCVPFNMGFERISGDIVLIQNPECAHVGDVIKYAADNTRPNVYISFSARNMRDREMRMLGDACPNLKVSVERIGGAHWYNHPVRRPVAYHFAAAMTTQDLRALGGFDQKYANGSSYDDDDLVYRIRQRGMQVVVVPPSEPYVIHQHHTSFIREEDKNRNFAIYQQTIRPK